MVLPTLFAACTAEDLVQNQNVGTALEGRALLDPLTINVSDETPVTRFSWNEATGGWNDFTANDKFSAGLVDNAEGNISEKVLTNYVYSSTDGVNYTTESQMVEGTYMFYSYKGFETSASRSTVDFNLTAQTADLADPTKTVEENQLFVTPLYKLKAEDANYNLNMKFVSYWSTAAIKIQNASEAPFKIVRMVLNGNFAAKGSLSPNEMNTKGYVYTYDKDTQAFVLDAANAGKEGQKTYEDFLTDAIIPATTTPTKELVLDCGSYEVEAGKEVMAYMQVPAGKYTADMTVDIVVETTDSKGASILKQLEAEVVANEMSEDATENDLTAMYRGQTTALFGYNDDKTPKAYKIDKIALLSAPDAAGAYASSFDDVYKYVTEADKSEHDDIANALEIYNIGDVKVDDEMVDLLSRMGVVVKFANPIDIELESTANTTVKNIVFAGDVTLKKGSVTLNGNIQTEANATLTISEGTSLKVTNATLNGSVVNNGTLELGTVTMPSVKFGKSSSLVVSANVTWKTIAEQGFPKTVTISKDATLKGASSNEINIPYTSTVTVANGGTLGDATATNVVNEGTIINNGTIENITNENNAAVATNKVKATITNNKKITAVTLNSGLIVMNNENASIGTVTGTGGEIDNTKDAFITDAGSSATVYVVYTGEKKGKLGQEQECNTIIFEDGTWTDPEFADGVTTFMADNVKIVKLDADGNIDVTGLTWTNIASLTLTNCTVDANLTTATITNAENLVLDGTTFNGTLGLGSTAVDLNLVGVTFNGKVTAGSVSVINIKPVSATVAATTKVNATVSTAATTAITVAAKATLDVTVNGTIGTTDGTITNNGTVNNRGTIKASSNATSGTWNGAAPENS